MCLDVGLPDGSGVGPTPARLWLEWDKPVIINLVFPDQCFACHNAKVFRFVLLYEKVAVKSILFVLGIMWRTLHFWGCNSTWQVSSHVVGLLVLVEGLSHQNC